jgi:hypothetical protein
MKEIRAGSNRPFYLKVILLTGVLVGSLDKLAAFADYYLATGKGPAGVLKYIASAALGVTAFSGNIGIAFLGLLFHYLIAMSFTFYFFWLYRRIKWLSKNMIITAIVYSLFIWMLMNLVIVPLSNAPHKPLTEIEPLKALKAIMILIFMIGLPLAYIGHRFYCPKINTVADPVRA